MDTFHKHLSQREGQCGSVASTAREMVPSCCVIVFVLCGLRIQVDKDDSFHRMDVQCLGKLPGQHSRVRASVLAPERTPEVKVHFGILCFKMSTEIPE